MRIRVTIFNICWFLLERILRFIFLWASAYGSVDLSDCKYKVRSSNLTRSKINSNSRRYHRDWPRFQITTVWQQSWNRDYKWRKSIERIVTSGNVKRFLFSKTVDKRGLKKPRFTTVWKNLIKGLTFAVHINRPKTRVVNPRLVAVFIEIFFRG